MEREHVGTEQVRFPDQPSQLVDMQLVVKHFHSRIPPCVVRFVYLHVFSQVALLLCEKKRLLNIHACGSCGRFLLISMSFCII